MPVRAVNQIAAVRSKFDRAWVAALFLAQLRRGRGDDDGGWGGDLRTRRGQSAMRPIAKAIAVVAIFLLLGPLVGGVIVGGMTVLAALAGAVSDFEGAGNNLVSALGLVPAITIFAYLLGGIPALLCGGWIGSSVVRQRGVSVRGAAIAGAVASLPLGVWLVSNDTFNLMTAPRTLITLGWYCSLGVCASVVCLLVCRRLGLVASPT